MKCIKAIKDSKSYKVNDILRVSDKEADEKVATGYFTFIPKSEWKSVSRVKVDTVEVAETKGEETKAHKAKRRSEIKAKQRKAEPTDKVFK